MAVGSAHPANAQSSATLFVAPNYTFQISALNLNQKQVFTQTLEKKFTRCVYQHLESSALLEKYTVIKFLGVQHPGKDSPGKDNTFGIFQIVTLTAMFIFDE